MLKFSNWAVTLTFDPMTLKLFTNILQQIAYKSSTLTYYESSIVFELFCVEIFKSTCDLDRWSDDLETFNKYSSVYCLQIFNTIIYIWKLYSFWTILCWNFQIELWPWPLIRWPWNFAQLFFKSFPTTFVLLHVYKSSIVFELFCVEIFKLCCDLDLWSDDLET